MSMQENKQKQYTVSDEAAKRMTDLVEAGFSVEYCDEKYAFLVFEGANKMSIRRSFEINPDHKNTKTIETNNEYVNDAIKKADQIRTRPETINDIQERADMLEDIGLGVVATKLYEKYPKKENAPKTLGE